MENAAASGLSCSLKQPLYFFITQLTTKCLHARQKVTMENGAASGLSCSLE